LAGDKEQSSHDLFEKKLSLITDTFFI
jgi:hypothetical protein